MPFNEILGVGRTPKITEDINSFAYGSNTEIQKACESYLITNATTNTTGDKSLITASDFDSINNIAYNFTCESGTTGDKYTDLIFDIGKVVYITTIEAVGSYALISGSGNSTNIITTVYISPNGTDWENIGTFNPSFTTLAAYQKRARFIKFRLTITINSVIVPFVVNCSMRKLRIVADSLQY